MANAKAKQKREMVREYLAISPAGAMLAHASALVSGPRDRTHGDKRTNHENIAVLWNAYVQRRLAQVPPFCDNETLAEPVIRALDVAHLMILLKVARTLAGEPNPDDYTDAAGYAACAAEIAGFGVEAFT